MNSFQKGRAEPRLLGDPGRPLERAVHAEERALAVDEREEARRRADDGAAEVALALEDALLACPFGEVADDEHELVWPAGDDTALVVALLRAKLHRVLDALDLLLGHRPPARLEDRLGDVGRKPLVDAPADDLVRRRHQVLLGVDLEAAVDPVRADPEDRVGDRGDEGARRRVARRGPVEPLVRRRCGHTSLVAAVIARRDRLNESVAASEGPPCEQVVAAPKATPSGVCPAGGGDPSGGNPLLRIPALRTTSRARSSRASSRGTRSPGRSRRRGSPRRPTRP